MFHSPTMSAVASNDSMQCWGHDFNTDTEQLLGGFGARILAKYEGEETMTIYPGKQLSALTSKDPRSLFSPLLCANSNKGRRSKLFAILNLTHHAKHHHTKPGAAFSS